MNKLFTISFFILSSCGSSSGPITEEEKMLITRDVKQMLQNYYADIRKAGLEAEFDYLDSSSEFFWVPPGFSSAISYDSVAAILRKNAGLFRSVINEFDTLSIIPISNHLATYTARISSTITDTMDNTNSTLLIETGVVIKRAGGWKLLNGQTSVIDKRGH
ncbi:nuclear transport factor 2 family protein [Flavitalea antarctica]